MKALLVTESAATGVGKHVCDLAEGLSERGHEVHLVYSPIRADSTFAVRVEGAKQSGVYTSAPINISSKVGLSDLNAVRALRKYIRTSGPFDVIHCHSSKAGLTGRLAAVGTGAGVVYTPHAFASLDPSKPTAFLAAVKVCESMLARLTDVIVAVSEQEKDHAVRIGLPSRRVVVISNGIQHETRPEKTCDIRAKLRGEWRVTGADFCIGFVGRLTRQKRVDILLSAAASVARRRSGVVVAVVGDGPLREDLRGQAAMLGIGNLLRWCGPISGSEVMPAFDALALTSQYEGFPYVLLEAMAAGLPIVTTDTGGARSVIEHGASGFVAPVGDAVRIAEYLTLLAQDESLRREMGALAAQRVKAFSVDKMVDATIGEYRRACAWHPARQALGTTTQS